MTRSQRFPQSCAKAGSRVSVRTLPSTKRNPRAPLPSQCLTVRFLPRPSVRTDGMDWTVNLLP